MTVKLIQNRRGVREAALLALLLLVGGCGGHPSRPTGQAAAGLTSPASPSGLGALLPAPAQMLAQAARHVSSAAVLEHCGAQFDSAVPPQQATVSGVALGFTPDWTPAQPASTGLAYALYRFNVSGYSGEPSLRFTWNTQHAPSDLFVAVADFPHNRWLFLPGPGDGVLTLTPEQFAAATDPGTQDFLVVPVLTGSARWELARLRIGPAPASTVAISAVASTAQRAYAYSTFIPTFTGTAASWSWDFGGGATPGTAVGKTPAVSLGAPGQYIGLVTATDGGGLAATFYFPLAVQALSDLPPLIYGVQPNSGDNGTQVVISAHNSGGPVVSWSWDFGGGATPNTPTDPSPLITLGAVGQYNASVTATSTHGTSTFNFTLVVTTPGGLKPPNVLGAVPASGTSGAAVIFNLSNAGGSPTTLSWDFGGGALPNPSTATSPHETLGAVGLYAGSVTASNSAGSSTCPFQLAVTELAAPHLTDVTPAVALPNSSQSFFASNNGGTPDTWSWDFGGGATPNTSSSSLPLAQLGNLGSYSCSVTASNAVGSSTLNFTLTLADLQPPHLTAVSPLSGALFDPAAFVATNTGGAVDTWAWNFGVAASPSTSPDPTAHVQLVTQGDQSCSVTATNAAGNSTFNFTLSVGPVRAPALDGVSPPTAQVGEQLSFSAHNTGGQVATWSWDFGGGTTPNTSTLANPAVQAGATGSYACHVTATNASGNQTFDFTLTISDLQPPVVSGFTPGIAETGSVITFLPVVSGGPPDTYSWDFGGGASPNTSSAAQPQVTTGALGNYSVTITVTNGAGSDTKTFPLSIVPFQG